MKINLKKLNQSGFDHVMVVVVFVVIFALIGTYLLISSHAATTYVELHQGSGGPCVSGAALGSCSTSNNNDVWITLSGSNFEIKNRAGQCIDDWNAGIQENPQTDTKAPDHTRVPLRTYTCDSGDRNQEWSWTGSGIHELKNTASGGCFNLLGGTGTELGVYSCNGASNEQFYETSVSTSSSGGSANSGSADGTAFINRAKKWTGLGYANPYDGDGFPDDVYGEGGIVHADGYAYFVSKCEGGTDGGKPEVTSGGNSICATDCSGFVSLVVDDVLHTNYVWLAGDEVLTGSGASNWKPISGYDAEPGDIAVSNGHVEFVDSGTGGDLTSFGEHYSGSTVSTAHMPTPFQVYEWE